MENTDIMVKVLAVDDDVQTLEYISVVLDEPDVKIASTTDPRRALDLFAALRPQLVLLDLMMPGIGGMELLTQMVAADPTIDVILVTSAYSTESAVEAIQKGACDYLTKPVDIEKVRRRIRELLVEARRQQKLWHLDQELVETSQSVTLVIVGHGSATAPVDRQAGLSPIQRLNLVFSSTHSTIACSGGFRYNPTTSVIFSRNFGSRDSLKVSTRCGSDCGPARYC